MSNFYFKVSENISNWKINERNYGDYLKRPVKLRITPKNPMVILEDIEIESLCSTTKHRNGAPIMSVAMYLLALGAVLHQMSGKLLRN